MIKNFPSKFKVIKKNFSIMIILISILTLRIIFLQILKSKRVDKKKKKSENK